jgi:hypothetical protein
VNIDPGIGKAALRLSLFVIVLAAGMLIFLEPGSPQFAITVFTLIIGLVFLGFIVVLVKRMSR